MNQTTFPQTEQSGPPRADWDHCVASLLRNLGSDGFPSALRKLIEINCAFDSMIATQYTIGAPPVSLYHDLNDVQAAISVQFYATGPYLLDPIYQACRKQMAPGAYRLLDLASEAFYRSEYFRTFYRKIRLSDEIGILVRQGAENWIVVSLARVARRSRFSNDDVAHVNAIFQTISAAVSKQWGSARDEVRSNEDKMLEDRLEDFATDVLSPREGEIVRLVLLGHSTPSAAAFLGIAEGTVKVHRHHAYAKLGITSQAELLALAARHFSAQPD